MPPPLLHGVVKTYEDQQRWVEHGIAICNGAWGEERLLNSAEGLRLSTAFSGTGGPEVALGTVRCALTHFYGVTFESEPICWAVDFFDQSQYELLMLSEKACVFTNMIGFLIPAACL